ncbi:MAG: outer membrane beta-barrel domain-containing protein [Desulfatitalea sp.]|nr:outer membrane beta-barrel domain-containing protein [Desulfatitalea sp.]
MKTMCTLKTMHHTVLMVATIILLLPLSVRSEIRAGSFEVSPFLGYNFFENRQNLKDDFVFGGRFGYNITKNFGIEVAGEFIKTGVDDRTKIFTREGQFTSPIDDVKITFYHFDLIYHFIPESNFNPYLVAGYGGAQYSPEKINDDDMDIVSFGLGAKYRLTENIALRLDLRDNMIFDKTIHNLAATIGVVFTFGGKAKSKTQAMSEPKAEEAIVIVASEPQVEEKVKKVAADPVVKPKVIVLAFEDVHFDFDQSVLTQDAKDILKRSVSILKKNPEAKIRIAGYTSASGTEEYNQQLSERRARAVYDYMTKEGLVPQENLSTIGYGQNRPAVYEPIPENIYSPQAKSNMRVLFQIVVE